MCFFPFNLIVGPSVKESIHLFRWSMLYQHSRSTNTRLWKEILTWVGSLRVKLHVLNISLFVALVLIPQRFKSIFFLFRGARKQLFKVKTISIWALSNPLFKLRNPRKLFLRHVVIKEVNTSYSFLFKRIISDVSKVPIASNQKEVVFQSPIWNSAFVLWPTEDGSLSGKLLLAWNQDKE